MKGQNYRNGERISGCQGPGSESGKVDAARKKNMRDFCGGGTSLYLDCINITILVICAKRHRWRKPRKEYGRSLCVFLTTACESAIIPKLKVYITKPLTSASALLKINHAKTLNNNTVIIIMSAKHSIYFRKTRY